jgi:uncharacterized protein (DUF1501 family)
MLGNKTISRRDSLVFGTLAGFGLTAAMQGSALGAAKQFGCAKRCVLIWLDGGPSHLETFDPKPDAAIEVRGPLGVIRTKQPGVMFGEGLPKLAERIDKTTIIRSMTSPVGEHNLATLYALTGHIPGGRAAAPAFSLPVASLLHSNRKQQIALPAHVALPNFNLGGGAKLAGLLGNSGLPWSLDRNAGDDGFLQHLFPNAITDVRLRRRKSLLSADASPTLLEAIDLVSASEHKQTFDIAQESQATRTRYGNKPIGQNCLLARRLLETGVPMVTINNQGWDTHDRLHERLHAGYTGANVPVGLVPSMDQAVAALLDDLHGSGLIEDTLVIVMGEFGRTPKINTQGGRDHWSRAYSVLLAGAGVKPGLIHGASDRVGENAADHPVSPADLVATLYHVLGIDPGSRIPTPDGQQLSRVPEDARVIEEILS